MCLFKFVLKKIAPIPKLTKFDNYVFVAPHPDDVEIGAGATAAKLVELGKKVTFIIATDGRYGIEDPLISSEEIIKIRQEEQKKAAEIIGVKDIVFLPFSDGGFYDTNELTKALAKEFGRLKPDVVFAPDHKLINECHADHIKTGEAATYAFISCLSKPLMRDLGEDNASPKALAYYYTDKPNAYVNVTKAHIKKMQAIREYKSQFPIENDKDKIFYGLCLYLNLRSINLGLKRFYRRAEGFRVLSLMHTHCAPEASKLK